MLRKYLVITEVAHYLLQVYQQVLNDSGQSLLDSLIASITAERAALETVRSDRDLQSIMHRLSGVRQWSSLDI